MKSILNRISLFAATAAFLGTAAYGQSLSADVPFGFRLPGGGASAGNYQVHFDSTATGKVIHFYNVDTHKSVLAVGSNLTTGLARDIKPRLVFRCSDAAGCALAEIWTPAGGYSVPIARPRQYEYTASIALTSEQGN